MPIDLDRRRIAVALAALAALAGSTGISRANVAFLPGPAGNPNGNVNNAGLAVTTSFDGSTTPTFTSVAWWDAGTVALAHPDAGSGENASQSETITAINDAGTIVGYAILNHPTYGTEQRAVRWAAPSATPVVLGGLLNETIDQGSLATAMNRSGLIVGVASGFDPSEIAIVDRATYWPAGSDTPVALGSLATGTDVEDIATAVNDAGTIAGRSAGHAVRWDSGSTVPFALSELGANESGQSSSTASAINRSGTIVGSSTKYEPDTHRLDGDRPVRWDAGQTIPTELGVPGEGLSGGYYTDGGAVAINAAGTTIGGYGLYNDAGEFVTEHALRWRAGSTTPSVLAPLTGGQDHSQAVAINASGTVVGLSYGPGAGAEPSATMWTDASDAAIDLNVYRPLGGGWLELEDARSVSDTGFITGNGLFDPDGDGPELPYERSYELLIPEAGTYGIGDATFDTHVDFADLLLLARHYGQASGGSIHVADFNLDGTVDFTDLLTLARHYGASIASVLAATDDSSFANDWALAQALAPEPSSALVSLGGGCLALRRRSVSGPTPRRSR